MRRHGGVVANIIHFYAVTNGVMLNELMHIQKELGQSPQPRQMRRADSDDEQRPEESYDPLDWLASPFDNSRFHVGYTTNHWLEVFRAVKPSV